MRAFMVTVGVLALASLGLACSSPGRVAAWEKGDGQGAAVATSSAAGAGIMAEAAKHWALRDDKNELIAAIAAFEKGMRPADTRV